MPARLPPRYRLGGDGLAGGAFSVNISIEGELCLGNANGDGNVNIDDLVLVITNWG